MSQPSNGSRLENLRVSIIARTKDLYQQEYTEWGHLTPESVQQVKELMLELIGPHESLSEQQVKDGRIYILGDPQADAVDRYRDELAKKVREL